MFIISSRLFSLLHTLVMGAFYDFLGYLSFFFMMDTLVIVLWDPAVLGYLFGFVFVLGFASAGLSYQASVNVLSNIYICELILVLVLELMLVFECAIPLSKIKLSKWFDPDDPY